MSISFGNPGTHALVSPWLLDLAYQWDVPHLASRERTVHQDEPLFLEGEKADSAFIIVSGRIRLATHSAEGKERHLMVIGASGLIGQLQGMDQRNYPVSAFGATKSVVRPVPNEQLRACIHASSGMQRQLLEFQERQFLVMLTHLELQGCSSAKRRVCHHLLGLTQSYGQKTPEGILISEGFTQQQMGYLCGLSRVSVANVFSELERSSVIGKKGRLVLIKDAPQLMSLARSRDAGV